MSGHRLTLFEPKEIEEAIDLLSLHGRDARLIAGGTDLLNRIKDLHLTPRYLIDLLAISKLKGIASEPGGIKVGPTTTFSEIIRSRTIQENHEVLASAAVQIGGVQIQNLGTIGGNICNAEPCADGATACISSRAVLTLQGTNGVRTLPIEDVFVSPGKISLEPTEILTVIVLPDWPNRSGGAYEKLSLRRAMDQSIVAVGVTLGLDSDGEGCVEIGIGLATAAETPMRAQNAERVLKGMRLDRTLIKKAAMEAAREARPRTSRKASAAYRRKAIEALVERCTIKAWEKARTKEPAD